MSERTDYSENTPSSKREIREAEIRFAKSTSGPEKLQALNELDELHVRLGEIKWQLANTFGAP